MDELSAERILAELDTLFVGRNLIYLDETGSTNDRARHAAEAGAPEGTLVVTDHQTAGRGRFERRWAAPPGSSLLMSLLFRPTLPPQQVQRLTMICGLAAVDAVSRVTGLQVGLKWPNDVVAAGAKLGGILTELQVQGSQVAHVVVGIGLNVNLDPAQLPGDLLLPATSLSYELDRFVPRLPLLLTFLHGVEQRYLSLVEGVSPHIEWASRLVTVGQPVSVSTSGTVLEGVAEAVDADGALLVRLPEGRLERVTSADVSLKAVH